MDRHVGERRRITIIDEVGETSFGFYVCTTCTPNRTVDRRAGEDVVEYPCPAVACRVYWGSDGCDLERGHRGPHRSRNGEVTAETAVLFGEDLTDDERKTIEETW